ncbi:MAG: hypothetical protein IANPNBLG_04132 [Bryobacteraceae bacterium]|nr:hypothetical protein [Bryobacteraceae bacterium]
MDDDAVEAVVYKSQQIAKQLGEEVHANGLYSTWWRKSVGRKTIKRGPGKRHIEGKDFHLPMRSATSSTAPQSTTGVTVGPLALFSTDTGDAWLLDSEDHLAVRLARDGDPEVVHFQETDTPFAIGWKGDYRIDDSAFVYIDRDTGRIVTILGYPVRRIAEWA